MALPHPDLAIVYDHQDITCYQLPDISTWSAETHTLGLQPLWSFHQHPSFPDLAENFAGYFFASKPICSPLTYYLHIISLETQGVNISSRSIEGSNLRSPGIPPVHIVNTSIPLRDDARITLSTISNTLIISGGGSDGDSFYVIPLDDVETGCEEGTLAFDIKHPVGIQPSEALRFGADFDETSGRAVLWKETSLEDGRLSSELAIVDVL